MKNKSKNKLILSKVLNISESLIRECDYNEEHYYVDGLSIEIDTFSHLKNIGVIRIFAYDDAQVPLG